MGFPNTRSFLDAMSDVLRPREALLFEKLATRGLPPVTSLNSLALLFHYSLRFIFSMATKPSNYYRQFTITKGSKKRKIDSPRVALKAIQSWYGHHLARSITLSDVVHGFVPGRSTVTAARQHCEAKWLLTFDIKEFFPTITEAQVNRELERLGYSESAAKLMGRLLTLRGRLPQGSPASPVLANLVFRHTDRRLEITASRYGAIYTRYADDLAFSGKGDIDLVTFRREISTILLNSGWTIASKKTRLARAPKRLVLLGLVVSGARPRLSKATRNKIRMMRHLLSKNVVPPEKIDIFRGYVSYANSIEPS